MGKKSRSGYGTKIPDQNSESLEMWIRIRDLFDFGSGIRDGEKNSDRGSGINIPDPQN
jgi:hypothetical protein